MKKIRLISDSACDLRGTSIKEVPFSSVPLHLIRGEKVYVDDATLNVSEMMAEFSETKEKTQTSCPNVADWLDAFGEETQIFVVTITSMLSGSYNAAMQARELYLQEHPGRKVCVIDSKSTGPSCAMLLEKLSEYIKSGMSFEEIQTEIEAYREKQRLLFLLTSVQNLAANGRIGKFAATAIGTLGICLVGTASREGTLELLHKCKGQQRSAQKLVETVREAGWNGGRVRIHHCENPALAKKISDELHLLCPKCKITVAPTGGLDSFYAERGGVLVGFEVE